MVATKLFLQKSFIVMNTVSSENCIIQVQSSWLMLTAFRIDQMTKKWLKPFNIRVLPWKNSPKIHWNSLIGFYHRQGCPKTALVIDFQITRIDSHLILCSYGHPSLDLRIFYLKDHMITYDHVSIIAVHRLPNYLCDIDDLFWTYLHLCLHIYII